MELTVFSWRETEGLSKPLANEIAVAYVWWGSGQGKPRQASLMCRPHFWDSLDGVRLGERLAFRNKLHAAPAQLRLSVTTRCALDFVGFICVLFWFGFFERQGFSV